MFPYDLKKLVPCHMLCLRRIAQATFFRSAAYAAGTYTAANFQGGAAGTPLPLNAWGAATLLVRNGGPYTFYAVDLAGNETVRTVDLPRSP